MSTGLKKISIFATARGAFLHPQFPTLGGIRPHFSRSRGSKLDKDCVCELMISRGMRQLQSLICLQQGIFRMVKKPGRVIV